MQVSNPNNVKIYNLSAGKSLPEWLSDRKKRNLQKQDVDVRRRIELLQDFEMPTVSHCIDVSPDGEYIYVAGTYKPRLRCYDVHQLSMKFEICVDSDIVKFCYLSEDYSKIVLLQCDRYFEFHTPNGRYYRTRIPKYGRDLAYCRETAEIYFVGVSNEIYRMNLEQGRFMSPLVSSVEEFTCCEFNKTHYLFACGSSEGQVECYDPRVRTRVGVLDTALSTYVQDLDVKEVPSVTALKFRGPLQMGVGTSTGHVLLYDLRSNKPLLVKDHQYELPIRKIGFHDSMDLVLSMDTKILKLWDRNTGKPYTAIEPGVGLNDMAQCPGSGLVFLANEAPKVLSYFLPSLGTAPRWCSFLDNLTEELEESKEAIGKYVTLLPFVTVDFQKPSFCQQVYDDYKFVTRKELDDLGLTHLIGSSLLRAYMHGFFIDVRLYYKAKNLTEPFAFDEYKKNKIREKIEQERENRVKINKLPKVNKELAEKLIDAEDMIVKNKLKKRAGMTLLKDDRFSAMFKNPDFEIDKKSEEYKLLNPVVSKLDKAKQKKQREEMEKFDQIDDDESDGGKEHGLNSDSSSSEDEHTWSKQEKMKLKKEMREARRKKLEEEREDMHVKKSAAEPAMKKPKFYEIKDGMEMGRSMDKNKIREMKKKSLEDRLREISKDRVISEKGAGGNKEVSFTFSKDKNQSQRENALREHVAERRKIRRSAGEVTKFLKQPRTWTGKR